MKSFTATGVLAGACALLIAGPATGDGAVKPSYEELAQRLQNVERELHALRDRDSDHWLTESRAAEVRALVHEVLDDAHTRASLLSGMQAGYDNGFQIGDPVGNFLLQVNGQLQARYLYGYQRQAQDQVVVGPYLANDTDGTDMAAAMMWGDDVGDTLFADRHRRGFQLARTKLWFSGHVINQDWLYLIEADFGAAGAGDLDEGTLRLRDAWIAHAHGDTGLVMLVGQFKLPFMREQLIDSRFQQAVERSLVHSYFTLGRSQGIMVTAEDEMFRLMGSFSDGARQDNTGWLSQDGAEFALTGRVEFRGAGTWGQFEEFRSPPGETMGLLVGVAAHWEKSEAGIPQDERQLLTATADASFKMEGLNLYGAVVYHNLKVPAEDVNWTNYAAVAQGGFHLDANWEVFGRWEYVWWDSDMRDAFDMVNLHLATVGVNHYFWGAGHSAKFTADVGYGINRVSIGDHLSGWRSDPSEGRSGQFVIRTQLQLAF